MSHNRGADSHEEGPPYRWNMKYYDWQTDYECEDARRFVFGEYVKMKTKRYGSNHDRYTFDMLADIVGREVEASFEGRSGGWFTIHDELNAVEYAAVTKHVDQAMHGAIKEFLDEERKIRREEQEEAEEDARQLKHEVLSDLRIGRVLKQLHKHFPNNFRLIVRGVDVVKAHEELLTEPEKVL